MKTPVQSEASLIIGLIKQDRNAQKAIFLRYHKLVVSIAMRYAKNQEDSEEIMNDVFVKVFSKVSVQNTQFSLKSWISRITINASIDRYRKNMNRVKLIAYNSEYEQHAVDYGDFDLDQDKAILPILQLLPDRYRVVFNLYVFEGYSHAEIAKKLNIAEGTSRSSLTRSKKIIKTHLIETNQTRSINATAGIL